MKISRKGRNNTLGFIIQSRLLEELGENFIVYVKLAVSLAIRDLINRHKWSKLGYLWPLVSFSIYAISVSIVYTNVFGLAVKGYLPYLASGIASWILVQTFMVEGVNLYITFKGLIVNIKLPFWVYHASLSFKALFILLLQAPVIFTLKLIFKEDFFPGIWFLPISILIVSIIGITISRMFAILGIIFRDFAHLVPSVTTILTLITPIFYPIELLDKAKWLYIYNPMYYLVSVIREPMRGEIPQEKHYLVCILILFSSIIMAEILENKVLRRLIPLL